LLGSRKSRSAYRCFFATDIHGSDRCYRKFLAAAEVYGANALILGGDIAGKAIVPLIANGQDRYRYSFMGEEGEVRGDEVEGLASRIRFNGFYPYVCKPAEYESLAKDEDSQANLFDAIIASQIRSWEDLAAERLAEDVRCIVTPGNDDPFVVDRVLKTSERLECPEGQVVDLGPVWLASLGNTNRTPWKTHREYDEPELANQIDGVIGSHNGKGPIMFNFHCPPFNSGLDTVAKLDANLRPVIEKGAPVEIPAGSTAVRAAIERYQPVVSLHGHIHEVRGVSRIGRTMCINPGSDYSSGWLKGVIVDFDQDGAYLSHLLTSG